jgi:hypothetical protein
MEYFVVLYSKQSLNIRSIMRRFESARGTPNERLAAAVDGRLLAAGEASYRREKAAFSAETTDTRAVAALVLAIDHR